MVTRTVLSRLLNTSALLLLTVALVPYAGAQTGAQTAAQPAASAKTAQDHIKAGDALREKQDWKAALPEYREAVRLAPDSPEAHAGVAWALSWQGDLDGAMREDREAIRLKPDYAEGHNGLGWCLSEKGNLDGAIREFREAVRLKPDYFKAHLNLGWAFRQKGDLDASLKEYREASRLQPKDAAAHFGVGWVLEHRGDRRAALDEYRKAIQLNPKNSAFRDSYGRVESEVTFLPDSWSPSMVLAFTISTALVPSFLLLGYFRARDLYPEPGRVLWTTFILGVLIVYPVLFIDGILDSIVQLFRAGTVAHAAAEAFFTAAIPEELLKFAVVVLFCARNKEFREPMDGIVYGVVASLGFATYENVGYVTSYGLWVAITRAIMSVPGHAFMGAVMGYFVGQWRFGEPSRRWRALALAYIVPVGLHWLYDFPLMAGRLTFLSYGIFIAEGVWALRLANRLRREQIQFARDVASAAAAKEGALDIVAIINEPDAPPSAVLGWVMTLMGGLIATAGAFLSLLLAIGLSADPAHQTATVILGFAIVGGIPLLIGLVLFIYGVKRIHASKRPVVLAAPLTPMAASAGV
jgi:RsiW-degrading membrane proteinase PrsW (M82 family)/Tfp pilus assembly protein PilF